MRTVIENPWVRAVGVLVGLGLAGLLAYALKPVLVPLFLALIVAYVLDPVVDFFEVRRVPRMATIVGLACVALVLALSVPLIIVPSVFHQAGSLIASARGVYAFETVDANGDRSISQGELSSNTRGYDKNDFAIIDIDHDGRIGKDEWSAAMASSGVVAGRGQTLLDRMLDRLPLNRLVQILELDKRTEQSAIASADGASYAAGPGDTQDATEPGSPAASESPGTEETASPPTDDAQAVNTNDDTPDPGAAAPEIAAAPEDIPHDVDARALLAEYIGKNVRDFTVEFMKTHAASVASFGQKAGVNIVGFFTTLGQGVVNFLLFLANFALFAIVAGYLLKDFDPLKATAGTLIPPRYAPKTLSILGKIDDQLRSFLRGQMTVCVCLGAMYTIGFLVCGVPFAILIGLFSVVAAFIPFVGVATTALLGITLTLLQHGIDWHLLGVLIVVGIAQFLEGNVLTPKIVGEQVGLNPVWVILAIMVFGNFLGFLGLLLAVPIAAALKVLVIEGVAYYKASPVFAGAEGSEPSADDTPGRRKKRR